MAKHAVLVGLKSVNPTAYGGWNGKSGCLGCEIDVSNVKRLLTKSFRFPEDDIVRLKTKEATAEAVLQALKTAADKCKADDVFVFYYSGHGGQVADKNDDEADGQDETLVCYNRELIDDELDAAWKSFKPGVRIVMLSDSCNSGSNHRAGPPRDFASSDPKESSHQRHESHDDSHWRRP